MPEGRDDLLAVPGEIDLEMSLVGRLLRLGRHDDAFRDTVDKPLRDVNPVRRLARLERRVVRLMPAARKQRRGRVLPVIADAQEELAEVADVGLVLPVIRDNDAVRRCPLLRRRELHLKRSLLRLDVAHRPAPVARLGTHPLQLPSVDGNGTLPSLTHPDAPHTIVRQVERVRCRTGIARGVLQCAREMRRLLDVLVPRPEMSDLAALGVLRRLARLPAIRQPEVLRLGEERNALAVLVEGHFLIHVLRGQRQRGKNRKRKKHLRHLHYLIPNSRFRENLNGADGLDVSLPFA